MLTQNDMVVAANKFFPNNYGVLITGSQQANSTFKKETDIDIIILDTLSSNQWNIIAEKDGYKIEFIILPVTDIENVLDNDLYEPKNGLLSLAQGKILSNPFGVIEPMLNKVKLYFNAIQFKTHQEYERYLIELMKLRKLFASTLSPTEKAIVLSDFVNIISLLETIRITNWSSKTKHKLRNLNAKSPEFLLKIAELFDKGVKNEFEEIITYINFYEKSYAVNHLPAQQQYKQFVLDIGYVNFSISVFVNEILPQIIGDDKIKTAYQYFYLSPLKYSRKYKHNICLVFSIHSQEQCLQLLSFVQINIASIKNPPIRFDYFCESNTLGALHGLINELKLSINKIVTKLIKVDNDFDSQKAIDIFYNLCYYAKKCFGISNNEFKNINSFIAQKWLFSKEEQQKADNYPALLQLRAFNMNKAELFYKTNMPLLLQLVLVDKDTIAYDGITLATSFALLEAIVKEKSRFVIPENDIYVPIFKASNFSDIKTIWLYKLVIESTLLVLNITDTQKFNCLYNCSKAINEIGVELIAAKSLQN